MALGLTDLARVSGEGCRGVPVTLNAKPVTLNPEQFSPKPSESFSIEVWEILTVIQM